MGQTVRLYSNCVCLCSNLTHMLCLFVHVPYLYAMSWKYSPADGSPLNEINTQSR